MESASDQHTFQPTFSLTRPDPPEPATLHLYPASYRPRDGGVTSAPSAADLYNDVNFNSFVTLGHSTEGPSPEAATPPSTVPNKSAAEILRKRGFCVEWSGIHPPQPPPEEMKPRAKISTGGNANAESPSTAANIQSPLRSPRAASLTDAESAHLWDRTVASLDRYLASNPARRDMSFPKDDCIPGLSGPRTVISTDTTDEHTFTKSVIEKRYMALTNRVLRLFHEAIVWEHNQADEQEKHARCWAVPLDAPLRIVSRRPSRAPALVKLPKSARPLSQGASRRIQRARLAVKADFYLIHDPSAGSPVSPNKGTEEAMTPPSPADLPCTSTIATIVSRPHLSPEVANEWVQPRAFPLARAASIPTVQEDKHGVPTSTCAPFPDTVENYSYDVETTTQNLTFQVTSQAYLSGVTGCLVIFNWAQCLLFCELRSLDPTTPQHASPVPEANAGAVTHSPPHAPYALTFAKHAFHSFLPYKRARLGTSADPDWAARELNSRSATDAAPQLEFSARPNIPWAVARWALTCYHRHQTMSAVFSESDLEDAGSLSERLPAGLSVQERGRSRSADQTKKRDCSLQDSAPTSVPLIDRMVTFPVPSFFGATASIYPCVLDAPADAHVHDAAVYQIGPDTYRRGTVLLPGRKFDQAETIVKAHRVPALDSEDFPQGDGCAPSLTDQPVFLSTREWQDEVDTVIRRTQVELGAYDRLRPLQGTCVPRLQGVALAHFEPVSLSWKLVLEKVGAPLSAIASYCPRFFLAWASQIREHTMAALAECPRHGVLHGDIHASNVTAEWTPAEDASGKVRVRVCLIDWSSATTLPPGTQPPADWADEETAHTKGVLDDLVARAAQRLRIQGSISARTSAAAGLDASSSSDGDATLPS